MNKSVGAVLATYGVVGATALFSFGTPAIVRYIAYMTSFVFVWLTLIEIIIGVAASIITRETPYTPMLPYHKMTAIITALLTNEKDIIMDTMRHYKRMTEYNPNLRVILAYNSPYEMELMKTLNEFAASNPKFTVLNVVGSKSKAENINAALDTIMVEPEDTHVIGLFDTDHQPGLNSFEKATYSLYHQGYDFVQGKCRVRNVKENYLTKFIYFDFELIYSVFHKSRQVLWGHAIFGGSNGYWRAQTLKTLKFDKGMLTEDIDLTMRAILAGHKGLYNTSIVSTEMAVSSFAALIKQRLRWAQGWFQVSKKYWLAMLKSDIPKRTKIGMFLLLGTREVFPYFNLLMTMLVFASIWHGEWKLTPFAIASNSIALLTYPMSVIAVKCIVPHSTYGNMKSFLRMLLIGLLYNWLLIYISIRAHMREFMNFDVWEPTSR